MYCSPFVGPPASPTRVAASPTGCWTAAYPILCFGDVIVSESVFQILDAGLDRDFFIIREYRVPGSQPARNG